MSYFFRVMFVLVFVTSFFGDFKFAVAQTNSVEIFENVEPVTILDRVSVFFTFNKEKKVQKLQDMSKRYALSGVSVMASGETERGQKFLDQSTKTIAQAITTVSQIQDEQIGDRLIASLAYDVVEQSQLIQPLQNQETQILRTTAQNLLEHNTRLLQTLSDTSFDQGTKKIQEGDIIQAERYLALAESHSARALSVASTLEHENQKQLVNSILDTVYNRIENISKIAKDSSDTRIQTAVDTSLRSTTSNLGIFADEMINKESAEEKSDIRIESAFLMLDSVVSLSKLAKPTLQQEILKTGEEKQENRLDKKVPIDSAEGEIVRIKKDSAEEKMLEKEMNVLLRTQSVGLENAIQNDVLSEDFLARIKNSRSRVLNYGKKMPVEKESTLLTRITDEVEKTSRVIANKKDTMAFGVLQDSLIVSQIEFIETIQEQKIKNIDSRASVGIAASELQNITTSLEKDATLLVDNVLLITDAEIKTQKVEEIKAKSEIREKDLAEVSEKNKESLGNVLIVVGERENVFQVTLDNRVNEQKQQEEAKKEEPITVEPVVDNITGSNTIVSETTTTIAPVSETVPVVEKPTQPAVPVKPVADPVVEPAKPVVVLPCKVSYNAIPVVNEGIDIGKTVQFTELEIKTDGCNADIKSFDIVVSGSVAPLVSRKMSQSCVQPASLSFAHEPRIMYWWGKVNLHRDIQTGQWKTDPDGASGANIDALTYCKKWYPKTVSVKDYKMEISDAWKGAGNTGSNHIALTLDNIRIQDDKGLLSIGPISTAQNKGLYSIVLPKPYRVTKNGARIKVSADIIGGQGLGIILWLSNIIAVQENSENILPVETQ
jgi:hypothetical protein